jgi:hypothetical protein
VLEREHAVGFVGGEVRSENLLEMVEWSYMTSRNLC